MTYNNAKKLIELGLYDYDTMAHMLDAYVLFSRITQEQYAELMLLMEQQQTAAVN